MGVVVVRAVEDALFDELVDHGGQLLGVELAQEAIRAEPVVAATADSLLICTAEYLDHVTNAEALLDAGHAREDLLGDDGGFGVGFDFAETGFAGFTVGFVVGLAEILGEELVPAVGDPRSSPAFGRAGRDRRRGTSGVTWASSADLRSIHAHFVSVRRVSRRASIRAGRPSRPARPVSC